MDREQERLDLGVLEICAGRARVGMRVGRQRGCMRRRGAAQQVAGSEATDPTRAGSRASSRSCCLEEVQLASAISVDHSGGTTAQEWRTRTEGLQHVEELVGCARVDDDDVWVDLVEHCPARRPGQPGHQLAQPALLEPRMGSGIRGDRPSRAVSNERESCESAITCRTEPSAGGVRYAAATVDRCE